MNTAEAKTVILIGKTIKEVEAKMLGVPSPKERLAEIL